jgi:hypothetical protein
LREIDIRFSHAALPFLGCGINVDRLVMRAALPAISGSCFSRDARNVTQFATLSGYSKQIPGAPHEHARGWSIERERL